MDIGTHVELVNPVKGNSIGTKGIVHSLENGDKPMTIQLYPLENNVVLEVAESDLTEVKEISNEPLPKARKKSRKTAKN